MKKFTYLYILLLPFIMLAAGCASEDSPEISAPSSVGFKINSRSAVDPGRPGDPVDNKERINSYKIFIVDANGKVRAVVEKMLGSAVEEDYFTADIPAGTYSFYAFANIADADITKLAIKDNETETNAIQTFFRLKQNAIDGKDVASLPSAPSFETVKSVIWSDMPNEYTGNIPMSGFRTGVRVTGKVEESFSIEVVRMLAKLEFEFSAPNAVVPVKIKKVWFHGASQGAIPFMPDYSILGKSSPALLDGVTTQDLTFTLGDQGILGVGTSNTVSTGIKYLRESVASHPSGGYLVSVEMERGPIGENGEAETDIRQYAIANELQYINRNDYIIIPIEISDWIVEIDVRFYPPIGGYPAAITEEKNREYYITFGTEGWFEIVPRVRNAAPGSEWLAKDKFSVVIPDNISGSNIFERDPLVSSETGEIVGMLNTSSGTAAVPVSITLKQDNKPALTFRKNIYIIKN